MEEHKREKNGIYRRRDIAHVVDAKHAASFSGDEADDDEKAVGRLSDSVRSSHIAEEKCSRRGSESGASSKAAAMAQIADEKERQREELREDEEANEEFERLKRQPTIVQPTVAQSQMAKNFVNGFKLISMNMRDALTGRLLWRSSNWDVAEMFEQEIVEEIPKAILKCRAVSREIIFSSSEEMENFRLEQRVYFRGNCIEEWFFKFGYVMSGSRNSWQQTIDAAPPDEMIPAEVLSGNIVFETAFFDGPLFLCKNSVRIYYV